jgi:transcriptional regulator with XRE-family HTH domain
MAKLILDIEPDLIDKIKDVAEKRNISLSELAKKLFIKETEASTIAQVKREDFPDWVKKLTLAKEPTPDFDHKKEYGDHIMRKYGL